MPNRQNNGVMMSVKNVTREQAVRRAAVSMVAVVRLPRIALGTDRTRVRGSEVSAAGLRA